MGLLLFKYLLSRERSSNSPLFFFKFNRYALYCLLISFSCPLLASAQWVKISSENLGKNIGFGVVSYQYGMLSLGWGTMLHISMDNGLTWSKIKVDTHNKVRNISDIDFCNKSNGLICTDSGFFITSDGGNSWEIQHNPILQRQNKRFNLHSNDTSLRYFSGIFLNLPENYCIHEPNDGGITLSFNNDSIRDFEIDSLFGNDIIINRRTHGIYFIGSNNDLSSLISHAYMMDYEGNWDALSGKTDFDCYSLACDPCNEKLIAVVNEETYTTTDGIACIYVSTDGGTTYKKQNQTRNLEYYCGSINIVAGVIFAQTTKDGVLRSTDYGESWISIGGPNGLNDSRLICAVTPDLIYAADDTGVVWMTTNSGGFPTGAQYTLFETPYQLSTDTIGGDISIPISLIWQTDPDDDTINVYFGNSKNLVYEGTTAASDGASLDIPGRTTSSISQIVIPQKDIKLGEPLAYCRFKVYADTNVSSSEVSFDLLQSATKQPQCSNTTTSTKVIGPTGCGVTEISQFLHDGTLPMKIISLHPNPAQDNVTIETTSPTNEQVNIEIYNALGQRVFSHQRDIPVGAGSIHLDTREFPGGVYWLRIGNAAQSFIKIK